VNFEAKAQSQHKQDVKLVYCLCMDLIDSTKAGLEFITAKLDHFNISLVEQIRPHLIKLGLDDAMLKFTGDGWLLMTHEADKVPAYESSYQMGIWIGSVIVLEERYVLLSVVFQTKY